MNPQTQFCPNVRCHASGQKGSGNIVVHSQKQRRYKCKCCGKTFSETHGTSLYREGKRLVHVGRDLVELWLHKAGRHAQQVDETMMSQQQLDLQQVQADEIRVKMQRKVLWMAMALMVSTRLWLGGVVCARCDMRLARHLARPIRPIALERRIVQGTQTLLTRLLTLSQQGGVSNTAYIERLNATFRQPIHCLARRTRTLARTTQTVQAAMFLLGCVYNFCTPHHSGSHSRPMTPAMAADITDQIIYGLCANSCSSKFPLPINRLNVVAVRLNLSVLVCFHDHTILLCYRSRCSSIKKQRL